jgi:hypothetical protein
MLDFKTILIFEETNYAALDLSQAIEESDGCVAGPVTTLSETPDHPRFQRCWRRNRGLRARRRGRSRDAACPTGRPAGRSNLRIGCPNRSVIWPKRRASWFGLWTRALFSNPY